MKVHRRGGRGPVRWDEMRVWEESEVYRRRRGERLLLLNGVGVVVVFVFCWGLSAPPLLGGHDDRFGPRALQIAPHLPFSAPHRPL